MREEFCSCPEVLGPPGYCKEKGVSHHPQGQDGSLGQHQIQAPILGLPGGAGGLEQGGDQRGTGNEGGRGDHRQFVQWWLNLNLGGQKNLFVVEVF